ncbi:MAG: hypothetical protein MK082_12185 [Phycisphaerales bacterium]|nr:hypothetical protein [Phycisphaerales bacterium]
MTTILPTDDLRPDLFVTVHSHLDRSRETARRRMAMAQEAGEEPTLPMVISEPVPDRTCYGVPLRIAAVNLPYVYCMVIEPGGAENGPSILDVRQVRFMRVNPETLAMIRSIGHDRVEEEDEDHDEDGIDCVVRSSGPACQ